MNKMYLMLFVCLPGMLSKPLHAQVKEPADVTSPVLFERGKISDGFANRDMAISPDGNELFYTIQFGDGVYSVIMHSVNKDGVWSKPETAGFSGRFNDLEPSFSPDGTKLYFSSNRPLSDTGSSKDYDIWFVTKNNNAWQNPQNVGAPVNTPTDEFYVCVTNSGNIYFTRGTEKHNDDIMMCRYENGHYAEAASLSDSINSDGDEFNAYVAADETFIIYTGYQRPEGMGSGDLYISRKNAQNQWGKAVNIRNINSVSMDYCPFVTADKKYLYFTSDRATFKTPFATPQDFKAIKNILSSAGNGLDDIYVIPFDKIKP